ncbi:MAG: CHRD domain-containing protein [Ilumatobacteraceae bacterium]
MQKRTLACVAAVGCAAAIAIPSIALGNARRNEGSLAASQAVQKPLVTRLSGANEVPPADPDGFGGAAVTFDLAAATPTVCWDLSYGNLEATPILAHIHGPAAAGATAPPVIAFTPATLGATSATGCRDLTAPEAVIAADIVANPANYYVNVHTNPTYPNGAIRGQLAAAPAPAGEAHFLPAPLRAYDSRTVDGPLALNATRTVSLATGLDSSNATVLAVPPGATAAIVTLTATDTTAGVGGPGGFLKIYSAALGTPPSTSSINWTGAGQNIAVTTQVAVDASGQVKVTDGANSTNFVVDVIGYLF